MRDKFIDNLREEIEEDHKRFAKLRAKQRRWFMLGAIFNAIISIAVLGLGVFVIVKWFA